MSKDFDDPSKPLTDSRKKSNKSLQSKLSFGTKKVIAKKKFEADVKSYSCEQRKVRLDDAICIDLEKPSDQSKRIKFANTDHDSRLLKDSAINQSNDDFSLPNDDIIIVSEVKSGRKRKSLAETELSLDPPREQSSSQSIYKASPQVGHSKRYKLSQPEKIAVPHLADSYRQEVKSKAGQWVKDAAFPSFFNNHVAQSSLISLDALSYSECHRFSIPKSASVLSVVNGDQSVISDYKNRNIEVAPSGFFFNERRFIPDDYNSNNERVSLQSVSSDRLWVDLFSPKNLDELCVALEDQPKIAFISQWLQSYKISGSDTHAAGSEDILSQMCNSKRDHGKRNLYNEKDFVVPDDYNSDSDFENDQSKYKLGQKKQKQKSNGQYILPLEQSLFDLVGNMKSYAQICENKAFDDLLANRHCTSAILLYSPTSTCKSSIVYAAAKQFNFDVIELNPATAGTMMKNRSGSEMAMAVGESLSSFNVQRTWNETTVQSNKTGSSLKDEVVQKQSSTLTSFFSAKPSVKSQKSTSNLQPQKPQKLKQDTLIYIKDVDICFNQDTNFWNTVMQFVQSTQSPIILSTSDLKYLPQAVANELDSLDSKLRLITLRPQKRVISKFVQKSLQSHFDVDMPSDILGGLCKSFDYNLKAILNNLQFLCLKDSIPSLPFTKNDDNVDCREIECANDEDAEFDIGLYERRSCVTLLDSQVNQKVSVFSGPIQLLGATSVPIEEAADLLCDRMYIQVDPDPDSIEVMAGYAWNPLVNQLCQTLCSDLIEDEIKFSDFTPYAPLISVVDFQNPSTVVESSSYINVILQAHYDSNCSAQQLQNFLITDIDCGLRRSRRSLKRIQEDTQSKVEIEPYFDVFYRYPEMEKNLINGRGKIGTTVSICESILTG
ncbi:hypothetical protein MP228_009871 [Amoeboaphelidium protococcarum]|nr:hypothetical protein MP228_009871 [Amoeboaphelidium protococcarum]